MDAFAAFWELVVTAGGGLALLFIVSLASGIVALTVVYTGSAIIVLERFARVVRRPGKVVIAALVVSAVASLGSIEATRPELAVEPWGEWLRAVSLEWLVMGIKSAIAVAATMVAFRRLSSGRIATAVAIFLTLCCALHLAAMSLPIAALVPVLLAAAAWGVLVTMRRRRNAAANGNGVGEPGPVERALPWMVLVLAAGFAGSLASMEYEVAERIHEAGQLGLEGFALLIVLGLLPLAIAGFLDMRGTAEWFIAVRYLLAKRRQVFISAITAICVVGIASGVWLIIVVLSVMNGFEQTWREEILGNRAHFIVHSASGTIGEWEDVLERVRGVPGVVAASPYLDADAMLRGRAGEIFSVRVRGIDPASVGDVTKLREDIVAGSLDYLVERPPRQGEHDGEADGDRDPGIILGNQLASSLGATVGDSILVISPFGGPPTPLGPAPRLARFEVAGVFQSSFYQFDEVYTYTTIKAAQDFRRSPGVIDGIEGLTTDYYRSQRVGADVAATLDYPFYTRDWKDYYPAFFQALKSERVMMFMLLTMIMVVAAFVIVATLIMMIMEKSGDIAILKAMGAEDAMIERIFALEGALIGLVGTILGVVAGVAVTYRLTWIQDQIEVITGIDTLPASVYQFSTLPSRVDPLQVGLVMLIAMVLSLGATLLPSRQGARLDPVEGLRHE